MEQVSKCLPPPLPASCQGCRDGEVGCFSIQQKGWGEAVSPGHRRCHHRATATGSSGATQGSAWATQLIWNNWKLLSPGLICCMTEYRLRGDLMWERGRAPGRMMALCHGNVGSFQGAFPRWAILGCREPRSTRSSGCLSMNPVPSTWCRAPRDQGSAAQPAPETSRAELLPAVSRDRLLITGNH